MAADATLTAYVGEPLCAGAERELAAAGGRAGSLEVRVACLERPEAGGRFSLAAVGANARRATEDSTAIAYVEAPSPANRFARPIVESATIPWITTSSGKAAMTQLLNAISKYDSGSLRESVRKALEAE